MNGSEPCRPNFPIASAATAASARERRPRQCPGCRTLGRGPSPPQVRAGHEQVSTPWARAVAVPGIRARHCRPAGRRCVRAGPCRPGRWPLPARARAAAASPPPPPPPPCRRCVAAAAQLGSEGWAGAPTATSAENAQALHFLRHHLCATLKIEYMAERSALALWTTLKRRFERMKYSTQPQAEAEWARLRFADFRSVGEYNSALHRICTHLQLCGVTVTDSQKIEKTLSTFHPDAVQSSRSYRQANYKEYSEPIDILQVDEAHDEVLKKNFVVQPLGASARPEVQANAFKIRKPLKKKRGKKAGKDKKEAKVPKGPQVCFRCSGKSHCSRECRAPQHVADAYKARKAHEANLTIYGGGGSVTPQVAPPQMIPTPPSLAMLQASTTDTTTPMDVEPSGNPPSGLDLGDAAALFTMDDVTAKDIALEVNGLMEEST
ncbi:hypothetical protein BRADI_2g51195v3 [Brachypodium distachyon]|uniref:Uncharacterized protein n=1 Tax=Brachypodium distachyon TaxID=15368 RepID=A0A2K2DFC1_BRADI|nr:hypothetical protein BRADI_2g51195v3 [Brachypodium distachyon]